MTTPLTLLCVHFAQMYAFGDDGWECHMRCRVLAQDVPGFVFFQTAPAKMNAKYLGLKRDLNLEVTC